MFQGSTIGRKIGLGFGVVLLLLAVIAALSVAGAGRIVSNAEQVIRSNQLKGIIAQREVDHLNWVTNVSTTLMDPEKQGQELEVEVDHTKCKFGQWLFGEDRKQAEQMVPELASILKEVEEPHEELHKSASQINEVRNDPAKVQRVYMEHTLPHLAEVRGKLKAASDVVTESVISDEEMIRTAQTTRWSIIIIGAVAIIAGIVISILIVRGIVNSLRSMIISLSQSASQQAAASEQVSSSSQSLAEGAAEQASALEETSSSLEEMSAMTRQNSDNADQANALAKEARSAAEKGVASNNRMSEAMNKIQESTAGTSRIIKTIDEIAFQTNLLALNAAVEAARSTAELIEGSITNTKQGVDITQELNRALGEIMTGSQKVSDLVAEIAAASKEQSQGIDQLNSGVGQMDKVTQSNASNAEETASAAEEMSSQASILLDIVRELSRMVGGANSEMIAPTVGNASKAKPKKITSAAFREVGATHRESYGAAPAKALPKRAPSPLIDDSFNEF